MARHRVMLVRQWDQQVGGSGCCGRLDADAVRSVNPEQENPFAYCRADMERTGLVYAALRERFTDGEVELVVVDPRNTVWLLPAVWRDARGRGLSVRATLRQVNAATSPCALVCDGLVLGTDTAPGTAVAAVETDLASRTRGSQ